MSAIFIKLSIDDKKCISVDGCTTCVKVCPVGIFKQADNEARIVVDEASEDECTLCDLCLSQCPSEAITLRKLY
jgi:ferredoxin